MLTSRPARHRDTATKAATESSQVPGKRRNAPKHLHCQLSFPNWYFQKLKPRFHAICCASAAFAKARCAETSRRPRARDAKASVSHHAEALGSQLFQ
ncbi:hypothetical protein ETH_00028490 [Eimeria tenella]|uniref:Uncharacterized protein n=1 Tax=Eimeria tenella TaxID=5802 RepID=U6L235_EIMTE|nr:hypothetical protein ETH_00028490 [Eimeria tenella]CDJ41835.1 hypothetical protein ETH_00028490 [Eimeria tenella]|eukprot:XP_013232585.1 hypothetical protein ETH_00028490 [Eimeria tenella]